MRLIDADALMPKLKLIREGEHQIYGKNSWGFASKCITAIEDAPTAEPKKGKWQITEAYPHNVYCSECHKKFAQTHWAIWEDGSLPRSFCPNCGAKMEGEYDG